MFEIEKITLAVEKAQAEINAKNLSSEQQRELNQKLELKPSEYATFQETKSLLQAQGILSLSSAQWIYNKLSHYSQCTLAEKYVLLWLFQTFLKIRMKF